MKKLFLFSICLLTSLAFAEDETKVVQKVSGGAGDSSVLIETTKNAKLKQDYEIVSGEEEIMGDPTAGTKDAYTSWKDACREWKKELKENNNSKDGQVLISSCGSASFVKDESTGTGSGIYTYKSNAKYKLKVRIKDR